MDPKYFRVHLNDSCGSVAVPAKSLTGEALSVRSIIESVQTKLRTRLRGGAVAGSIEDENSLVSLILRSAMNYLFKSNNILEVFLK